MLELARRAPSRTFNMVGPLLDRHVAEGRGDTPALRTAQRDLSYGELQELVNRAKFVDELPKTASGKVQRYVLRQ